MIELLDELCRASERGYLEGFREAMASIVRHSLRSYECHEREHRSAVGNQGCTR